MRDAEVTLSDEERIERNEIIRSLLDRLDRHSPNEKGHAERVAVYAVATGDALGLSDTALQNLRYAAVLHDVGKVSIDAELLQKAGGLTDEEMDALRLHALIAAGVVEAFDWLQPCIPDIRHHHERWDGGGYPDGLAGTDIPLGARIINLSESYDVMLTGLHGFPRGEEAVLAEVIRCSGTQFDPGVVEAFLQVQPLILPLIV